MRATSAVTSKPLASRMAAGFAIQLGLDGVHDHRALHVVDPEVFVVAIAHPGDGVARHGLGLGAAQLALASCCCAHTSTPLAVSPYRLLHLGLALLQAVGVLRHTSARAMVNRPSTLAR